MERSLLPPEKYPKTPSRKNIQTPKYTNYEVNWKESTPENTPVVRDGPMIRESGKTSRSERIQTTWLREITNDIGFLKKMVTLMVIILLVLLYKAYFVPTYCLFDLS